MKVVFHLFNIFKIVLSSAKVDLQMLEAISLLFWVGVMDKWRIRLNQPTGAGAELGEIPATKKVK
jgi:hypothetical protein